MEDKTVVIISNSNFTLFKGLSQRDLSSKNPAEHNRLNIRPLWSHGLDENGRIQRFDFVQGDNTCPEYIVEWESFKSLCDNGTLSIKGSYSNKANKDSGISLSELKKLQEENKKLKEDLEKLKNNESVDAKNKIKEL